MKGFIFSRVGEIGVIERRSREFEGRGIQLLIFYETIRFGEGGAFGKIPVGFEGGD